MGMFDYVAIEDNSFDKFDIKPSPRERPINQTKAFECTMAIYVVRNKRLYRLMRKYRETDEVSGKFGDLVIYKKELVKERMVEIKYHGIFRMSVVRKNGDYDNLYVKFTDGKLTDILEKYEYQFGEGY